MSKKLTTKGECAKHLRPYGKRAANKKLRKIYKVSLKKVSDNSLLEMYLEACAGSGITPSKKMNSWILNSMK